METFQWTQTQKVILKTLQSKSWEDFQKLVAGQKYQGWAFRGQEDSTWPVFSTLSRYLKKFNVHQRVRAHQEDRILRIFRRKANLFLQHIPGENEIFEWLALMQHHGAPTRLLDFTWSPFVAGFFALERAENDCAVWAVNYKKIKEWNQVLFQQYQKGEEKIELAPRNWDKYKNFYLRNSFPFVTTGEPFTMSQRLIAQSGTFLIPGILDQPVEKILKDCPDPENTIVKFVLKSSKVRDEAMKSLYYMNITNATLFPGLDGMARALNYELEFHWAF